MFLNTVSEAKKLHLSKEDVLKVYDAVKFNDRDCSSSCLFFGLNSAQFKSLFQFLSALQISDILGLSNSFDKNVMFTISCPMDNTCQWSITTQSYVWKLVLISFDREDKNLLGA